VHKQGNTIPNTCYLIFIFKHRNIKNSPTQLTSTYVFLQDTTLNLDTHSKPNNTKSLCAEYHFLHLSDRTSNSPVQISQPGLPKYFTVRRLVSLSQSASNSKLGLTLHRVKRKASASTLGGCRSLIIQSVRSSSTTPECACRWVTETQLIQRHVQH